MSFSDHDPELLLVHDRFVRRLARQLLIDEHVIEDVVQQTWVAALERGPRQSSSVRAWLTTVVRHFALRMRITERRRLAREQRGARPERVPSTEEILEREAVRKSVVHAVLELPEPYREVMVLRYFEDLPPRRIGKQLDLPVETVRTRIKRALDQLRERLDREHPQDRGAWWSSLAALAAIKSSSSLATVVTSLAAGIPGALVMSAKVKAAVAASVLIVSSIVAWQLTREPSSSAPAGAGTRTDDQASVELPSLRDRAEPATNDAALPQRSPVAAATSEPPAAEPTLGSLKVRTLSTDKTAAGQVGVYIIPWSQPNPFFSERRMLTGADGCCVFTDLEPGHFGVYAGGNERAEVDVVAGQQAEATLEIPVGIAVDGVVVNAAREPVANADIWVSTVGNWDDGWILAATDASGKFKLTGVHSGSWLGARAPGYTPTPMLTMMGSPGGSMSVKLVFQSTGGEVTGTVLDPDGERVAGAVVRVGSNDTANWVTVEGGSSALEVPSLRGRTDARGDFRFRGVRTGNIEVAVRAPGFAPWRGHVVVLPGEPASLDVQLEEPATVTGTVKTADQKPAARVQVLIGRYGDFMASSTSTRADGSFELAEVAVGTVTIEADGDDRGKVAADLTTIAGRNTEWNAVLDAGLSIAGRVQDERDQPLSQWWLVLEPRDLSQGYYDGRATTDRQGRFLFKNVKDVVHLISVHAPGGYFFPTAMRDDVRPGHGDVVFRIRDRELPTAYVCGAVVDTLGKPVSSATVSPCSSKSPTTPIITTDAATGRFRIGPITPGEYSLIIRPAGHAEVEIPVHDVKPQETWDLGDIQVATPGSVVVHVRRPPGGPQSQAFFTVVPVAEVDRAYRKTGEQLAASGDVARSPPLNPGAYFLEVGGADIAHKQYSVQVRSGEDTEISVTLMPGYGKTLHFDLEGSPRKVQLRYSIQDAADGAIVARGQFTPSDPGASGAFDIAPVLAAGQYRVLASTDDGLQGECPFGITDGSTAAETVTVSLR
ncbi:MAG: sigma-70 family RNA polymerase sigma factor [Planctomycetota bacterium]